MGALQLLREQPGQHILLITSKGDQLEGVVTQADILRAIEAHLARGHQIHMPAGKLDLPNA